MKRIRRLLALAATICAVTLGVSGCDSSPFAASVNSHVIKETALQAYMKAYAADPAYVRAQAGSQTPVHGRTPGTYTAAFAASKLDELIEASALSQALERSHHLPSPALLAAARSIDELAFAGVWTSFNPALRQRLVDLEAYDAALYPVPSNLTEQMVVYQQKKAYFFSRVCTRTITVSVTGSGGGVDMAASLRQARQIESRFNGSQSTSGTGGAVTCYTPAQLEDQGAKVFDEVLSLAPGHAAAPQPTSYGYTVLAVDSRTFQPFGPPLVQSLDTDLSNVAPPATFGRILEAAKVKVNPAFGTWDVSRGGVVVPGLPAALRQGLPQIPLG